MSFNSTSPSTPPAPRFSVRGEQKYSTSASEFSSSGFATSESGTPPTVPLGYISGASDHAQSSSEAGLLPRADSRFLLRNPAPKRSAAVFGARAAVPDSRSAASAHRTLSGSSARPHRAP